MLSDLKFSETVYGFDAGDFFIGYFLFEDQLNGNVAIDACDAAR